MQLNTEVEKCHHLCLQLRSLLNLLNNKKNNKNNNTHNQPNITEMMNIVLQLSQVARNVEEGVNEGLVEVEKGRREVESVNEGWEVLCYEKEVCLKEIASCQSARFDESSVVSLNGPSPMNIEDGHQAMLARLNAELDQRKRLVAQADALRESVKTLQDDKAAKTRMLEVLESKLKPLAKNSSAFQQYISILPKKVSKPQFVQHLPTSLYVLYQQACTYCEYFDNEIVVDIAGDLQDAIKFDIANSSTTKVPPQSTSELYKIHPLSVVLHFCDASRQKTLKVHFAYYINPTFLTAKGEDPSTDALLANLFPNDDGSDIPSPPFLGWNAKEYELVGRPYKWLQWLGGLPSSWFRIEPNSQSPTLPSSSAQDHVQYSLPVVMKQLKEKKMQ